MIPSIAGILVILVLLAIGRLAGSAIIVGLFASLAFGSTAAASVGNSSPLIYAIFALLLVVTTALRQNFLRAFALVFREHLAASVACILAFYAIASAIIFPRLFAGEVSAFVPVEGAIVEIPLAPVKGNVFQTSYLIVGVASFLSLRVLMFDHRNILIVRKALFAYVIANVLLGIIDLAGKITGTGDWLFPIRTAEFAMLTEVEVAGFWRIVGGHSEASSFAGSCLACVSFTFIYWRRTASRLAFVLMLILLLFLAFGTSSTAYGGLAVLGILAVLITGKTLAAGRVKYQEFVLFVIVLIGLLIGIALYLYNEHLYDSFDHLIQTMVFEKASSDSGLERSYWNQVGLRTFFETYGLGIGMGSSRSSSLFISVISQLGIFGALLGGMLLTAIFTGAGGIRVSGQAEIYALISAARAMAIGSLVASGVAGSGADPGLLFFLILAVILGCKYHLRRSLRAGIASPDVVSSLCNKSRLPGVRLRSQTDGDKRSLAP